MKHFLCVTSPKEDLCLHTQLEESSRCQVAAQQEADLAGTQVVAQHVGLSEEPGPGGYTSVAQV